MSTGKAPLEGIRVLDLGRYQAGPRAGLVLARLGAEVIKVEAPGGDESRNHGPFVHDQSAYWVQYNSGKKSITLDLRKEDGRAVLRDLVKVSDVLIQNFRPGTIAEMGFSYDVLQKLNARIVMLNVSAYGQDSPYRERIGFDFIGQAIGGLMSLTGFPENPPTKIGAPVIDRITALHGAIGVLAALREREFSGQGQAIDVCLADAGFSLTEIPITNYLWTGRMDVRKGNSGTGNFDVFEARDGWVVVAAPSQHTWERLCECIGKPDWITDPRFSDAGKRWDNSAVVREELTRWFSGRSIEESVEILSKADVPCAPTNNIAQAASSPQLWERELLVEVADPVAGTIHVSGKYIKLSRSETVVGPVPAVGQHTKEVLCGLLHYAPEHIQRLQDEKVI